jgi:hypothetical protein
VALLTLSQGLNCCSRADRPVAVETNGIKHTIAIFTMCEVNIGFHDLPTYRGRTIKTEREGVCELDSICSSHYIAKLLKTNSAIATDPNNGSVALTGG